MGVETRAPAKELNEVVPVIYNIMNSKGKKKNYWCISEY